MDSRMQGFVVGNSYQALNVIGEGAYGVVCSAVHRITPFDHSMFCLRTLREIKLLRHFHHENIIAILDILRPPSIGQFAEVYLVQELMETDLHRVIRHSGLSDDHCQYFIYQTLRALKASTAPTSSHRDLKPSNLLLNANCDLKLCDLASPAPHAPRPTWYRAPEVMLTFKDVGCVLAEMLSGKPLFPGRDYHHQLSIILDILGTPSIDDFYAISSQRSREYIRALPFRKKKPFSQLFPKANPDALDLMEKCLTFSPKRRIEVGEALAHPPYHDPADEPTADPIDPSFFDFDNGDPLGKEDLKVLIYEEIMRPDNPAAPFVLQSQTTDGAAAP
ncbi:mitogen activated protein kinase-like protein [Mycena sp. CBHHK59/15]|nr:mitogen activated protein kinase-like protein [Mycena sp. CBHHK59/15]